MSSPAMPVEAAPADKAADKASGRVTVLCVDDEPQVLAGLALNLGRRYHVLTAASGAAALEVLHANAGTAVIISDMRMPAMDGAAFLRRAREAAPDAVRMLLTGQSDIDSAISAVNEGQIFRFLSKPCPTVQLLSAIQAAVEHHRLITAERVLLEQTLRGSIAALVDVLALSNPVSFGRASRIKAYASKLSQAMNLPDPWQVEVAAMLSQLGYVSLPDETMEKVGRGQPLSAEEEEMLANVPAVSERLIASIPRLEVVREMLATLADSRHKPSGHLTPVQQEQAKAGGQVLRAAVDFENRGGQTGPLPGGPGTPAADAEAYDPELLEALQTVRGGDSAEDVREVRLADLQVGMIFAEDVKMDVGTLLVARGFVVSAGMVERARNIRKGTVSEPVRVIVPRVKPV